ncbi:hypothetical protein TI39_contig468g00010 [Zymoseptoria brevis]|uniref:Pentatricopeptide repeat protein n=1 Tax=Zymoseptoria brevis TaxID=1047168 RepID=A0A0F4GNF1_9PEZI|nr:hypothetical protein TI39_contig468g00010 [Zymoseptoria brevis]
MKCYGSLRRPSWSWIQSIRSHDHNPILPGLGGRNIANGEVPVSRVLSRTPLSIKRYEINATQDVPELEPNAVDTWRSAALSAKPDETPPRLQMGTSDATHQKDRVKGYIFSPLDRERIFGRANRRNVAKHVSSREVKLKDKYGIQKARHNYTETNDWRIILRLLEHTTQADPKLYLKKLVRVNLPEGTSAEFKGNAGVAVAEIMDRTNCHVQMAPGKITYKSNRPDSFTALDLLGSFRENALALDLLPEYVTIRGPKEDNPQGIDSEDKDHVPSQDAVLTPDTNTVRLQTLHDAGEAPQNGKIPIRSVWANIRSGEDTISTRLAQRPKDFTTLSMSAYISDLCRPMPRQIQYEVQSQDQPGIRGGHVGSVGQELLSMFRDRTLAKFLSTRSLSMIIDFFEKNRHLDAFRELVGSLGEAEYAFTASDWNRILAATAKDGDVHNHYYTLKAMLRQGLSPTPRTWVTFHDLVCRRFPSGAHLVVDAMHSKGVLQDRQAAEMVARNAVEYDLARTLAKNKGVEAFIQFYDHRFQHSYGLSNFNWLSIHSANRMLKTLLTAGRKLDVFYVLDVVKQRNPKAEFNEDTLDTLLSSALFSQDVRLAVSILRYFRVGEPGSPPLSDKSWDMLFTLVWRRRYYNTLKVVWYYACAGGHSTSSMVRRMHGSLYRPLSVLQVEKGISRGDMWVAFAPRIALGLVTDLQPYSMLGFSGMQAAAGESSGANEADSHLSTKRADLRSMIAVVNEDVEAFRFCRPTIMLIDMLESAYIRDIAWKGRGLGMPSGLGSTWSTPKLMYHEMAKDAVHVPLSKRRPDRAIVSALKDDEK